MNPCKCGWHGHHADRCKCTENSVARYQERLSGPLLDRVDIYIETPSLEFDELRENTRGETSAEIRLRVNSAREIQRQRYSGSSLGCNAHIGTKQLSRYCALSPECESLMRNAYNRLSMTARSYDRILRVARTIADLENEARIAPAHLAEAIQYRMSR
jgi:magnesium chelatase family protein